MAISVTCPDCEHTFSVRDEFAGKRGKCPKCGGVFRAEPAAEPAISVSVSPKLAARSGVALGGSVSASANGGYVVDAPVSSTPAPAGKKSGGKKKSGRGHQGPSVPIWGWITIATLGIAAFVGGGMVYMVRGQDAMAEAEKIDDGSKAEKAKEELLDQIKSLEKEIDALKTSLANAEKAVGAKPKEKSPLGEIEKRIIPGVVKVIPYVNGQPRLNTATGFFLNINGKMLVATTHRVCEGASKLMIKLPTGTEYEVEGMVAAAPNQDIAILKPKGEMPGTNALTLAENVVLSRGDTVYAVGNPGKQEFTTTRGAITRVLDQAKYIGESPKFDVELRRDSGVNASFIEHDSRIFPGDYGGPLLNENLEVIGMNQVLVTMFMNDGRTIVQTFGAAEEIKHVKALADKATDTIIPYPPAAKKSGKPEEKQPEEKPEEAKPDEEKMPEAKPDDEPADPDEKKEEEKTDDDEKKEDEKKEDEAKPADTALDAKINELYTACDGFEWTPKSDADYGKMADVARYVTEAKLLADDDVKKQAATEAADKVLTRLAEFEWDKTENIEPLNKYSAAAGPKKDGGMFFAGIVKGQVNFNEKPGLMVQIEGSEKFALVMADKVSEITPGSRWLILGQYETDQTLGFKTDGGVNGTAVVVRSKVLVTLD